MSIRHLELADFRIFRAAGNRCRARGGHSHHRAERDRQDERAQAFAYLATRRSFRTAPPEAMVRTGAERAIVRAEIDNVDSPTLVEAEILPAGRSRTRVNRKSVSGRKELAAAAPCTVFSPEDLVVISGGPRGRRDLASTMRWPCSTPRAPGRRTRPIASFVRAATAAPIEGGANDDVAATLYVGDEPAADAGQVRAAPANGWRSIGGPLVGCRRRSPGLAQAGPGPRRGRGTGSPARRAARPGRRPPDSRTCGRGGDTRARPAIDHRLAIEGRVRTHASQG